MLGGVPPFLPVAVGITNAILIALPLRLSLSVPVVWLCISGFHLLVGGDYFLFLLVGSWLWLATFGWVGICGSIPVQEWTADLLQFFHFFM